MAPRNYKSLLSAHHYKCSTISLFGIFILLMRLLLRNLKDHRLDSWKIKWLWTYQRFQVRVVMRNSTDWNHSLWDLFRRCEIYHILQSRYFRIDLIGWGTFGTKWRYWTWSGCKQQESQKHPVLSCRCYLPCTLPRLASHICPG